MPLPSTKDADAVLWLYTCEFIYEHAFTLLTSSEVVASFNSSDDKKKFLKKMFRFIENIGKKYSMHVFIQHIFL